MFTEKLTRIAGLSYGAWSIKGATLTRSQPTLEAITS